MAKEKRHQIEVSITTEGQYNPVYKATGQLTTSELLKIFPMIQEIRAATETGYREIVNRDLLEVDE